LEAQSVNGAKNHLSDVDRWILDNDVMALDRRSIPEPENPHYEHCRSPQADTWPAPISPSSGFTLSRQSGWFDAFLATLVARLGDLR
jgi:hypothetical protein